VAARRRRDEDSEPTDDTFDDVVDDDADDVVEDDVEDADADADDEPVTRGGTTTRERRKSGAKETKEGRKAKREPRGLGIFTRIGRFVREVVAELRKVIWPTRKELVTYTAVVVVFVAVMLTVVGLLDLGFAKAVLWAFGN